MCCARGEKEMGEQPGQRDQTKKNTQLDKRLGSFLIFLGVGGARCW